ncbi:hypothetical protein PPTG_20805 [Phytophthora nicotianae INRA-310]|uniref:Uncharacterized protein n=1 Tax=Phytophthora nicotianae (strain INRA-310) TaxID=761204 RepID=W2RJ15_PHYN3|nr:hypothetical protein PPTG_20805 [Phytophthora nicotianae INRA-310]ETN24644.1 hypothetical protein PPTG_20805 [Phytophthora nicotianae INRA-310]
MAENKEQSVAVRALGSQHETTERRRGSPASEQAQQRSRTTPPRTPSSRGGHASPYVRVSLKGFLSFVQHTLL